MSETPPISAGFFAKVSWRPSPASSRISRHLRCSPLIRPVPCNSSRNACALSALPESNARSKSERIFRMVAAFDRGCRDGALEPKNRARVRALLSGRRLSGWRRVLDDASAEVLAQRSFAYVVLIQNCPIALEIAVTRPDKTVGFIDHLAETPLVVGHRVPGNLIIAPVPWENDRPIISWFERLS